MKIYLAGSCSIENRTIMMSIVNLLRAHHYEVLAPFEYKVENEWEVSEKEWALNVFQHDCELIQQADLVLVISPGRVSTAGTNWEQGYAYGLGKRVGVIQIGWEPTSLMTFGGCNYFESLKEFDLSEILAIVGNIEHNRDFKFCDGVLT